MTAAELRETEEVPVRKIWLHEALDFTPWLATNLSLLSECLNMEIILVKEEAEVGDFSVDILADDARTGAAVVIENQLEWTDHDHLGKVLTYAGWQDARTLIWISPHFRDEHRAALDWLNRCTPRDIRVFGVEIHTTSSAALEAKVELVPVVFPDDWTSSDGTTPIPVKLRSVQLREFFQPLVDELNRAGFTKKTKAAAMRMHPFPSGVTGLTYQASLELDGRAWVYIPGVTSNLNALRKEEYRQEIIDDLALEPDTDIEWRSSYGSLGVYRRGSLGDEEQHGEIRQWMFDYLIKFKEVFNPRMEKILDELESGEE